MLSALVVWTALLAPQEGGVQIQVPADQDHLQFSPYRNAQGTPVARPTAAGGAADVDGDGNADLWFLSGEGAAGGALQIQMADAGHVGRYRAWHSYPPHGYTDAATFHSKFYTQDRILMADPTGPGLRMARFQLGPISGDPRDGAWFDMPNFWLGDTGIFEIETRNDNGDEHDDIVVMIDLEPGGTVVKKLVMEGQYSPLVTEVVQVTVPLQLEQLTLLDFDGDGRTDFAAAAPGAGVVVFHDDGTGGFTPVAALVDPTPVRDLISGDLLGTGRDALGVAVDFGVLIGCFTPTGIMPYWLPNLPGRGSTTDAELLASATGLPQVITFPSDGRDPVVHPFDRATDAFRAPEPLQVSEPNAQTRPGVYGLIPRGVGETQPVGKPLPPLRGIAAFTADIDADGDPDVVLSRRSGAAWITLPNTARSLRLGDVTIENLGEVGETGYVQQSFTFPLPPSWDPEALPTVEAAVYRVHPADGGITTYWGRLLPEVDPIQRTVSFLVYTQLDPSKLSSMYDPHVFRDGITSGGKTAISVHGVDGARRHESVHMYHDPGGDGNGSGSGATWTMTAAPPLPTSPQALLPWAPGSEG